MNHDTILRIDELERMWPVMKNKLKYYDDMMSKISDLESKAVLHEVNANKNNDYLSSKIDSVNVNLQERLYKIESRFDDLSPIIMNLGLNDEKQKFLIENLTNNFLSFNSHFESLTTALNNCSKTQELDSLKQDYQNLAKECRKDQIASNSYIQELYQNHQKVLDQNKKMLEDLKEGQISSISEELKLKRELQALQDETKSLKLTQNTMFHDLKNAFNPMIDDKISSIPVPVIPSLDDAKSAMQKVLEPVSLDAKNANLRSTNTDAKLHILEKKIEQLKLMLDQITLGA